MAITEERRHRMYSKLEHVMGHDDATTLIDHLPPVGWADVATKHDLMLLKDDLSREVEQLRGEVRQLEERLGLKIEATVHREISALKSGFVWTLLASQTAWAGVLFAAVKLV
jgi:hypothetical protein